jgi:putative membrane protein
MRIFLEADWEFDPWVVIPLLLSAVLYVRGVVLLWRRAGMGRAIKRWQAACFATGWATLVIAVVSPLHELGEHLFTAHMIEHELLMAAAAPLLAVSRPLGAFLQALPRNIRGGILHASAFWPVRSIWHWLLLPLTATVLHGIAIWIWHIPVLLDATLTSEALHRFQHICFLGTGLIFWWAILRRARREHGVGALHVFATMVHTGVLGALLTLAPRVLYPVQTADAPSFGLSPLEDQQLAGLFMWIPGGVIYLAAGLALLGLWLGSGRPRGHWIQLYSDL